MIILLLWHIEVFKQNELTKPCAESKYEVFFFSLMPSGAVGGLVGHTGSDKAHHCPAFLNYFSIYSGKAIEIILNN